MEQNVDCSRRVILVYIIIALMGCLVIIYNFINGNYYNSWFQRSTITFRGVSRDPNYVAGFIAPMPILVMTYKPQKNYAGQLFLKFALVILGIIALIVNGSRGGIISSTLPIIIYVVLKEKKLKKRIVYIIIIIAICFVGRRLIVDYLPTQTVDRLLFRTSGDTRTALWKAALIPFYNNPIIGQGIGSASFFSRQFAGNYSHNMYIDILSCSGILGFIVYVVFLVENIKSGKKMRDCLKNDVGLIALAFLLPQFFLNGFNTVSMWLPCIMIHHVNVCYNNDLIEKRTK